MRIKAFVGLMIASSAFLAAQTDPPGRVGRLNYMEGPVSFQPAGLNDWEDASLNRPLTTNDNIWVGDRGRAEFHVGSAALRLGANTAFQFLNLDDRTVQIRLSEGTLTVRLRNLAQDQIFEVDTPNLAFTLVRPGEYRIDANPDSQTTMVTVRDGEGDVTGGGQDFPVYARQRVVVRGDDQITYNLAAVPGADVWDQWCSSRDAREDRSVSARYVSRDIPGYDDLDQYGRWDNQPGYGDVWMPTTVAVGWAPYHDGHWAWIAPWGWTWVDDAPWGFAPFHYGRWASFGGRWGWVPGPVGLSPVYAPALVAWLGGGTGDGFSLSFSIGTAAAVGWFPLGPREPYVPSYQVSQGYFSRVNTTNTVINTTTINNYYNDSRNSNRAAVSNISYVNRNVQGSVTAVPQTSFARGRRVAQDGRAVTAAQLGSVQVFAAPSIAPQRESVLGARADTSSRAARPPANVTSRPVVARTAPAPASVPFDRQQQALSQNPGRPLPQTQVQQLRQGAPPQNAPVRVVDMGRLKRVQPGVAAVPQGVPQQSLTPQAPGGDPQNGRGRQQPPQPTAPPQPASPQDDQQKGRGRQPVPPTQVVPPQSAQPPVDDRQKGRLRQQPQQQPAPPQAAPPHVAPPPVAIQQKDGGGQQQPRTVSPPPINDPQRLRGRQQSPPQAVPPPSVQPSVDDQQRGRGRLSQQPQPQTTLPVPPVNDQQKGRGQPQQQAPVQTVQPPVNDQQRGRGQQQPQQQPAPPKALPTPAPVAAPPAAPPPPAPAATPAAKAPPAPAAPKQGKDKGKQSGKEDDKQTKSDR